MSPFLRSVEMIAPDQNTGDSTKDGVVNVFGTGQVTFTGKASVSSLPPFISSSFRPSFLLFPEVLLKESG